MAKVTTDPKLLMDELTHQWEQGVIRAIGEFEQVPLFTKMKALRSYADDLLMNLLDKIATARVSKSRQRGASPKSGQR